MDREAIALAVFDAMDVGAGDVDMARGRRVRAGHHLEQRGLAGAVRPDDADDRGLVDDEIGFKRERRAAHDAAPRVDLADVIEDEQRRGHQ